MYLTSEQLQRDCSVPDLTDPQDGPHAIQLLVDTAVHALTERWGIPVRWARGPRVVEVAENYDLLGFAPDAVSRDTRYTRYVDETHMLRSHSSAMVPAALRSLAADERHDEEDVLIACPGIVFRRDAIDWQHTGTPHQLDLWRVARRPLGDGDMHEMIEVLLGMLVPGKTSRQEARVHPYTLNGRQVDALEEGRWIEVWECGLAHPDVLAKGGLDPADGWHGLALGMGLDRLLMLTKRIPDIRLLRSADERVAQQMQDLEPYRPVSLMPATRRDLSIAVAADDDEETLGDRVRDALGEDAAKVQEVAVVSSTPCDELPPAAAQRLGALPGQTNVLVRMVLADLEHTLTDEEANELRDRVYETLHQGSVHQWASHGRATT
jgi:phenylalanyl-tRNA synthetase alpha chain